MKNALIKPLTFTKKNDIVEVNTAIGLVTIQSYIKGKAIYWTKESACSNDYYIIDGNIEDAMSIVEQVHQETVLGWLDGLESGG